MSWDAIGATGEWVGALATIGTLFYLANQVRQSTRASRSAAYQAASAAISDWSLAMSSNAEITRNLFLGIQDPDAVDDETRGQLGMQLNGLFRNYENIYYQWREGAIEDGVWEGWARQASGIFWQPGVQRWWPTWRDFCHADFRAFLEGSSAPERPVAVELPRSDTESR